ncbi:MAG: alcohol dehydrogenase catalytic domain-containing protein, partial [Planctomycetes bacterium]|nr:alcohol dehydrogenase catalytic domain-containing protein [Planctomycetota bacterium]
EPEPNVYDCVVEIDACAVCTGTDSNIISGDFPWLVKPPFILGHESTGLIVECGEKVENFELDQRVTRAAGIFPGERVEGIGSNWGGFAELGLVRDTEAAKKDGVEVSPMMENSRRPIPPDVDPVSGALSVNLREILSVATRLDFDENSRVVIIGSGYNGMLFSLYAKLCGAGKIVMVGNSERALLAEKSFGADDLTDYRLPNTPEIVADLLDADPTLVIDAVGKVQSVKLAGQLLGSDSAFGRYGLHEHEAIQPHLAKLENNYETVDLSTNEVAATDRWYELWEEGFYEREGICDGTISLDQITDAFEKLARREAMKLVVTM